MSVAIGATKLPVIRAARVKQLLVQDMLAALWSMLWPTRVQQSAVAYRLYHRGDHLSYYKTSCYPEEYQL